MVASRVVVVALTFFLFAPLSFVTQATMTEDILSQNNNDKQEFSGTWSVMNTPESSFYPLIESSGYIHSPFGSFDPLVDFIPLGPENLFDPHSLIRTGMAIVQSNTSDMSLLSNKLDEEFGVSIVDVIPDDTLIIRIVDDDIIATFEKISRFSEVRWIGELPIAWKISKDLLPSVGENNNFLNLQVIPSPDLSINELSVLNHDLSSVSISNMPGPICDISLCQLTYYDSSLIPLLAMDGRILKIEKAPLLSIHNNNARSISNIDEALSLSEGVLNGDGEVIAISDTGLDADHGDFGGRLRNPVYNDFGPDNSGNDANSGHGTHVAATLLGDGSGDPKATGMIPESTFIFYQLEVDSSGIFARWDSLYAMFSHAWQRDAKIQTNSWGSSNLLGEYTSDSRSADAFIQDQPRFLVLFSAGDESTNGISSPGTAKNVLTVGASTTGAYSSDALGDVFNYSSQGYTLDGRIKPDLVAPGVMICSARAEEAQFAMGQSCSDTTHSDGTTPLYMTLNGSSMATPVVAGAAAMTRQYLREEVNISEPRSDLLRAILINGASDLGAPDIPNPSEGWGQLDLSQSLYPKSGDKDSNVHIDYTRALLPGHSFLYTFDISEESNLDATLVWNDKEGSATGNQSISKLVNNLDLKVISPSGITYNGNNFISGVSVSGGSNDLLNNVERVRLNSVEIGLWTIEIGNSRGNIQEYSLVFTAIAEETYESDLSIIPDSISSINPTPLQGDLISINTKWSNRASLSTGQYSISVEDLFDGSIIQTSQMNSLDGGEIESLSFIHSFSTTGEHILQLKLDYLFQVDELNDELNGINNNIFNLSFNVSQIGVRITPLLEDGTVPVTYEDIIQAKTRSMNPSTQTSIVFELELRNEGTAQITVDLTVSPLQVVDDLGIMNQPQDEWWKLFESGPWVLNSSGQDGDSHIISLNLSNRDADITNNALARYSLPGEYVTDLTLYDNNTPTVYHSIRLTTVVDRIEGLFTLVAGQTDLGAKPGEFGIFSLSIRNIGNGPTQYNVSCETPNRWIIHIGSSESSELTLDPLNRLQFLPLPIRVKVPKSLEEQPEAGVKEEITCITMSVADSSIYTTEWATIEVLESKIFSSNLYDDDGNPLGSVALSQPRAVINGDTISTELVITNLGNVESNFDIQAYSSLNTWPIQVYLGTNEVPINVVDFISITLSPGENSIIIINTIVPLSSQKGEMNTISIKTTSDENILVTNGTKLRVQEIAALDVIESTEISIALGNIGLSEIDIKNVGNVPLDISLSIGNVPDEWEVGFLSGNFFQMEMNRESIIMVSLSLPGNIDAGNLFDKIPIIVQASTPEGETITHTVEISVIVLPSVWLSLESKILQIEDIGPQENFYFEVILSNRGNVDVNVDIEFEQLEGWKITLDKDSISNLNPGMDILILVSISPSATSSNGLKEFKISANSSDLDEEIFITNTSLILKVSKARDTQSGGITGFLDDIGLPSWTIAVLFIVMLGSLGFTGAKMRRNSSLIRADEELIPAGSALLSGSQSERRSAALDTSTSGEVLSGGVSEEEINQVISASLPSIEKAPEGAAALPLSGLPEGWTMEQWVAYGHMWWEQNKP